MWLITKDSYCHLNRSAILEKLAKVFLTFKCLYLVTLFSALKHFIIYKINARLAMKEALPHGLQHLTACDTSLPNIIEPPEQLSLNNFFDSIIPSVRTLKIQNGRKGYQNGRQGLEGGLPLGFWALLSTFAEQVFWFEHSFDCPNTDQLERRPLLPICILVYRGRHYF